MSKKTEPEDQAEPETKPKPGDSDYDWSVLYGTDDLYLHTFPDGTVVALKSFTSIFNKTWLFQVGEEAKSDWDIERAAIKRGTCEVAKRVLMSLDPDQGDPLDGLFSAWAASAEKGLKPGE